MRPPECAVCDKRFDPFGSEGELVSFEKDPADAEWYQRAKQPGFVGHPPHEDWFCAAHAPAARALEKLSRREALTKLRASGG
ncbi:MAG: hypothetical protein RL653_3444 [Pseudomonadota bacterium]|jgi:hypothetical protein